MTTEQSARETAWLVEIEERAARGGAMFWCGNGWVAYAEQAVRFSRQQDAEAAARHLQELVKDAPAPLTRRAVRREFPCQRIDPAPAPSEPLCGTCGGAPASSLPCICGGAGTQAAEVQGMREELLRLTAAAPPAPLARDMTLRQYLAAHAPYQYGPHDRDERARWVWKWADQVLAAEGRKP